MPCCSPATRGRRRRHRPGRRSGRAGRAGLGLNQGPGLDAVVALAARQAQTQGATPLIRQDVDLGAEASLAAPEGGIPSLLFGRARRARVRARPCCPAVPRTAPHRPAGKPSGAARCPARTRWPSGDRPSSISRTRRAIDAKGRPTAPSSTARPKIDNEFHCLRIGQDRFAEKGGGRAIGIGQLDHGRILLEAGEPGNQLPRGYRGRAECPIQSQEGRETGFWLGT